MLLGQNVFSFNLVAVNIVVCLATIDKYRQMGVYCQISIIVDRMRFQQVWSGGAMVLGKHPVPGPPTIWMR